MPLIVKDYTWTQTESMVYLRVPLKGATAEHVDILSTDEYLKVHFPPFLLEAFLFEAVDEAKSTAKIGNGVAVISLPKKIHRLWDHLVLSINDKQTKKEIRERALQAHMEKTADGRKEKAVKKQQEKKYALETMMKLEQEERDLIQKMKDEEREKATAELEGWKKRQIQTAVEKPPINLTKRDKVQTLHHASRGCSVNPGPTSSRAGSRKEQVDLPAPRSSGTIQIKFTPRVFPTALRESRVPEEEEWLRKQAEARRAGNTELAAELKDLSDEERNPDWLKDKGDKYFATGNYQGAVNAYNLAIRLNSKIPAFYSNRAACHLKLRNLHKALDDTSKALDLLTPPVADNASARARAHVRRGTAFCELELYTEGLQDYSAAIKIDPQNKVLQADAHRIRQIIQGCITGPEN
ncbi:dynein assembly factor 4, axonemal [Gadus chalcogrammus]|uniref:dynein assembly factor 4, axonemal n=1 Tax=Gadus chalcogrammus TaxID=1042646 RepID=UPI0024C4D197|nr:dynein assembly factor 4, axonemal [Gadus chalcogrammus]